MPDFRAEQRISAPPQAVFARFSDLGALARRSKRVNSAARLDAAEDAPIAAGASWRIEGDFGPFAEAADVEVVEHAQEEAIRFQTMTRGWRTALHIELAEQEADACLLRAHWTLDPVGVAAMRAAPMLMALAPMMQAGLSRALGKVAKSFEASGA